MDLKERTEAYLNEKGVSASDIPKAFAAFTAAKYGIWLSSIILGIRYRPLHVVFNRPGPKRWWLNFQKKYPEFYKRNYQRVMSAADKVASTNTFRFLADRISTDKAKNRSQAALGLAEGMLLYKIFLPVHLPLTFWAVTKYYAGRRKFNYADSFDEIMEDYKSERIYDTRILNAYADDLRNFLDYTKAKYIPEYVYNFSKGLADDKENRNS